MTVEQMRQELSGVYHGNLWRMRVSGMDDRQVTAIYKCMQEEGRLYPHGPKKRNEPGIKKAIQTCMFDRDYSPQ